MLEPKIYSNLGPDLLKVIHRNEINRRNKRNKGNYIQYSYELEVKYTHKLSSNYEKLKTVERQ